MFDSAGNEGGIFLLDPGSNTQMTPEGGLGQAHPQQVPLPPFQRPENQQQPNMPYSHPKPFPTNYSNPYMGGPSYFAAAGPSYQPPPPSQVGYSPTMVSNSGYINLPSSGANPAAQRAGVPAGFAVGAGAGALAAGAVMFGNDLMSGFNVPPGLGDASLTIATDPLF